MVSTTIGCSTFFQMNPVLKLVLLMGLLEFGGKRVSAMTQNVFSCVISMVEWNCHGMSRHLIRQNVENCLMP